MEVNEQAVGAMQAYLRLKRYILPSGIAREALQAAAPFLSALEPSAAREMALEEAAQLIEANMLVGGEWPEEKIIPRSNPGNKVGFAYAAAIRTLSSPDHADAGKVEGDGWWPIDDYTPKDQVVLMAWKYQGNWEYEAGIYGSTRGGWLHGQASHWRPLPTPPAGEVTGS